MLEKWTFCVNFKHRDSAVPHWKIDDYASSCIFENNGAYGISFKIDKLVVATEWFAWNLSVKLAKNTVPYPENGHI